MRSRIITAFLLAAALGASMLAGCTQQGALESGDAAAKASWSTIDMGAWRYDQEHDAYWQTGISYCENPADPAYETLGLFVPGAFLSASDNGDGTFTCTVDAEGTVNGFTALTAPIVMPVDTPGYMAMAAPDGYQGATAQYTQAGFVYLYPGCRGRDAGAPAGVTDLKAAIRFVRSNAGAIPGDMERIFSFGMSGGGAQSAVIGASGDSALFDPYLKAIGAVEDQSDAVAGAMCWCPVTSLGHASEAYEWNMGSTRADLSDGLQQLSDAMAEEFALHVNGLELADEDGNVLALAQSDDGIYQSGSYYEYLKEVIEESLDHFLADTTFPYTATESLGRNGFGTFDGPADNDDDAIAGGFPGPDDDGSGSAGDRPLRDGIDGKGGFGGPNGTSPKGGAGGGKDPHGTEATGAAANGTALGGDAHDFAAEDSINRVQSDGGLTLTGTYDTPQDYIDALNADGQWVAYDNASNTVSITSIADFSKALKRASKALGAFDALDESQGENVLFGDGDGEGDHFDATMAELVEGTEYADGFAEDLQRTDAQGTSVEQRVQMYDPLYYLVRSSAGYGTSQVATYWRIRSGLFQGDTALTTEVNLSLALENYGADVDFETVWGQGHTKAERTGSSDENLIAWVQACAQG